MSDKKEEVKPEEAKAEEKKEESKDAAVDKPASSSSSKAPDEAVKTVINIARHVDKIVLNSEDEKFELERIRRWKVHITEITIFSYEMFDCFLHFTIGGDLRIDTFNIPAKNKKGKRITGERGFNDCTEVLEITKPEKREKFNKEFSIEMRDSIINLMKQNLVVECWDYNSFKLNNYIGYSMIELISIIKGSIYQNVTIEKKIPGDARLKKPVCKVEFKILFQEIWDFVLTFEDWSVTNVNYLFGRDSSKEMYPGIEFFNKKAKERVHNKVGKKGTANPEFSLFNSGMNYRGTENDLENQVLEISIEAHSTSFIDRERKMQQVDLKGITVNGLIKKYVPPDNREKLLDLFKNEEDYPPTMLNGKINVNAIPRFKQIGFESQINEDEIYICIYLQKLTFNQAPAYCRKAANVFVSLEYNGKTYETNKIPLQIADKKFNSHMYYLVGIENTILADDKFKERVAEVKLQIKQNVTINCWVEDEFKCLDYIGKFDIQLKDIVEDGKLRQKFYRREDTTEVPYMPKVYSSEESFESSYVKSQDMRLKYDVWFYPESFTKNVDVAKGTIVKKFNQNPIITLVAGIIKENTLEWEEKINIVKNRYLDIFKKRFFEFLEDIDDELEDRSHQDDSTKVAIVNECREKRLFYVKDQNKNYRLINSYLSKLTIQEVKFDPVFLGMDMEKILKEKAKLEKIMLPLENCQSLLHYMRCMRYINGAYEHVMLSPDYFMQTRKGTKFEHTIFLGCLMMNMYSNKHQVPENDEEEEDVMRLVKAKFDDIVNNNTPNNDVNTVGKVVEIEGKTPEHEKKLDLKEEISLNITPQNIGDEKSLLDNSTNRSANPLIKQEESLLTVNTPKEKEKELDPIEKIKKVYADKMRKELKSKTKKKLDDDKFDSSDLVFVCMGSIKGENQKDDKHMWIMTFETNFKDIIFWEPMTNKKYVLKDRVDFHDILRKYFKGSLEKEEDIQRELKGKKARNIFAETGDKSKTNFNNLF